MILLTFYLRFQINLNKYLYILLLTCISENRSKQNCIDIDTQLELNNKKVCIPKYQFPPINICFPEALSSTTCKGIFRTLSNMKDGAEINDGWKLLTIFAKRSILHVWQYVCDISDLKHIHLTTYTFNTTTWITRYMDRFNLCGCW